PDKVCWLEESTNILFPEVFLIPRRRRLFIRPHIDSILFTRITGILCFVTIASAATLLVNAQSRPAARGGARGGHVPAAAPTIRYVPDDVQETSWLERVKNAQIKAMTGVSAFHDFQFSDKVAASGITFRNHIVDDAGKTYKAAHYDHGTGIAVADVDRS